MNCIFRIVKIENGFLIIEGDGYNSGPFSRAWQAPDEDRAATLLSRLLKTKDGDASPEGTPVAGKLF